MAQKEKEQDREKERKNRKNRRYGQTKLKHAKRGVLSCVLSGIVGVLLIGLLTAAYVSGGTAAPLIGGLGLSSVILAGTAFYMALKGFREREKDYLTCKIGVCCSSIFIILYISIFCRGLF